MKNQETKALTKDFDKAVITKEGLDQDSKDLDIHIGKRLRRRRRLLEMTQGQLADTCGVRFQQIQKYECGANRISATKLWQLSNALDVPVGYFYDGFKGQIAKPSDAVLKDDSPLFRLAAVIDHLTPNQLNMIELIADEGNQRKKYAAINLKPTV